MGRAGVTEAGRRTTALVIPQNANVRANTFEKILNLSLGLFTRLK